MIATESCVACGSRCLRRRSHALVEPFVARRVWDCDPFAIRLDECAECGMLFYNPRLEAAEERRLYEGYRLPPYQKLRQSVDPWYTEAFNRGLSDDTSWRTRGAGLRGLFDAREALRGHRIARVLDFGGDRGELTRAAFPEAEHFVYDISGVKPAEGVRALHSMEECATVEFDLILTSNVLEHVGSPLAITRQIAQVARPGIGSDVEVLGSDPAGGCPVQGSTAVAARSSDGDAGACELLSPAAAALFVRVQWSTRDGNRLLLSG